MQRLWTREIWLLRREADMRGVPNSLAFIARRVAVEAELVDGGLFRSVDEARSETFSYIDGYYNRIRKHSALGYLSPEQFERQFENLKKE